MQATVAPATPNETDQQLLAALFNLRKKLAAKHKLPAFLIFTDAALREICARKPQTREELLSVRSVGEAQTNKYGTAVLNLVRQFCED